MSVQVGPAARSPKPGDRVRWTSAGRPITTRFGHVVDAGSLGAGWTMVKPEDTEIAIPVLTSKLILLSAP